MAKVYKVVQVRLRQEEEKDNVTLRSVFTPDQYEMEYLPRETQTPLVPGSFLYAFRDLFSVQQYVGNREDSPLSSYAVLRVYSAEAQVVQDGGEVYYTLDNIDKFWAERWWEYGTGWPHVVPCPPGTVWCESIKLLDEEWNDGRALKAPVKPAKKAASTGTHSYQRQIFRY